MLWCSRESCTLVPCGEFPYPLQFLTADQLNRPLLSTIRLIASFNRLWAFMCFQERFLWSLLLKLPHKSLFKTSSDMLPEGPWSSKKFYSCTCTKEPKLKLADAWIAKKRHPLRPQVFGAQGISSGTRPTTAQDCCRPLPNRHWMSLQQMNWCLRNVLLTIYVHQINVFGATVFPSRPEKNHLLQEPAIISWRVGQPFLCMFYGFSTTICRVLSKRKTSFSTRWLK